MRPRRYCGTELRRPPPARRLCLVVRRRPERRRHPRHLDHRVHRLGLLALVSLVRARRPDESLLHEHRDLWTRRAIRHDRPGPRRPAHDAASPANRPVRNAVDGVRTAHRRGRGFLAAPGVADARPHRPDAPRDHGCRTAADGRRRACLAALRAGVPHPRGSGRAGVAIFGSWLFRRQLRHPAAGTGFQLLDLGPVPDEGRGDLLL